jgi:hypothetical protein
MPSHPSSASRFPRRWRSTFVFAPQQLLRVQTQDVLNVAATVQAQPLGLGIHWIDHQRRQVVHRPLILDSLAYGGGEALRMGTGASQPIRLLKSEAHLLSKDLGGEWRPTGHWGGLRMKCIDRP